LSPCHPLLKDIPFLGSLLFNQTPPCLLRYLMVIHQRVFQQDKAGLNYKAWRVSQGRRDLWAST
jgi:hypothetical protein